MFRGGERLKKRLVKLSVNNDGMLRLGGEEYSGALVDMEVNGSNTELGSG
ncbi:hypothetical protein A2U01_0113583 [Trifolium medium]|uniref:Uncharacterized protein n=1 Tax=Trifolium medium TaxID=97028 RepID=A0A392VWF8_9FABA|nr:hypothetical protein [Trifolium medium]